MDKKIFTIIILSLIIIGLVWIIWLVFSRGSNFETIIEQVQGQRDSLIRSTAITEAENIKIRSESAELRENNIQSEENNIQLETENKYYREIIGEFTAGDQEAKQYLGEYGNISNDFAEFLEQATITN